MRVGNYSDFSGLRLQGKTAGSEIDTVNKAYLVGRYIDPIMIDIAPILAGT
jgi:hypothetical protein